MDSKTNGKRKLQTETPDGDSSDFEDGELRLDRKDTKVWLVKIPSFLYEQWTALPKAGVELGRLKIFKEPTRLSNGKQEPKVSMSLPSASSEPGSQWAAGLPKNYNLRFTNTAPVNEFVFTEDAQGRATEVVGKIQHEATIGPVVDDDYRRIMQERTELATTKARFSQFMDAKESKSQGFKAGRDDTSSGFGIMVCLVNVEWRSLEEAHAMRAQNREKKTSYSTRRSGSQGPLCSTFSLQSLRNIHTGLLKDWQRGQTSPMHG